MVRSFDLIVMAQPVPWHRAGRGKTKNGRTITYRKAVDTQVQYQIRVAWMTKFGELGVIPKPLGIRLAVTAFLPAPKGMSKRRRLQNPLPVGPPDVDNLLKQIKDSLSKYAFQDDSQVVTTMARKRYALGPDGEDTPPRWVITLEVIDDGSGSEGHFAGIFGSTEPDHGGTSTSLFGSDPAPAGSRPAPA